MKLILSTSNTMTGSGPGIIRRSLIEKSNTELTNSLRANFSAHQEAVAAADSSSSSSPPPYQTWTTYDAESNTLYVPSPDFDNALTEERSSYDITVKLFYLPSSPAAARPSFAAEAVRLVLRALNVPDIDLLIASFPHIAFDADDEEEEEEVERGDDAAAASDGSAGEGGRSDSSSTPSSTLDPAILPTWRSLEALHAAGLIRQLGVSEFSSTRLQSLLPHAAVRPSVDQINVRDCCVVPKPLILYAKRERIELLTHNDCTDILPGGTVRELLGRGTGAGVLSGKRGAEPEDEDGPVTGLKGDVTPLWVVKYTAVVKDRGVVENKGYFAVAELQEE